MAERRSESGNFWAKQVLALGKFETEWVKVMEQLDFSADGNLDNHTEKTIGNRLLLSGPLVDGYVEEIGKLLSSKLTRSKLTGLVPPIVMFIPWEIMGKIVALFVAYGSDLKNVCKGKKSDKVVVICEKHSTAEKVFSGSRFDGTNYLRKRFFANNVDADSGDRSKTYNGCAQVVFSTNTPLRLDYNYASKKVTISFYVQRYNKDDFAVDASLQRLMNDE